MSYSLSTHLTPFEINNVKPSRMETQTVQNGTK